jgi:hypothetical protein
MSRCHRSDTKRLRHRHGLARSRRRAVMLSRYTRMSPDLAQITAHVSVDLDEGVG